MTINLISSAQQMTISIWIIRAKKLVENHSLKKPCLVIWCSSAVIGASISFVIDLGVIFYFLFCFSAHIKTRCAGFEWLPLDLCKCIHDYIEKPKKLKKGNMAKYLLPASSAESCPGPCQDFKGRSNFFKQIKVTDYVFLPWMYIYHSQIFENNNLEISNDLS